MAINKNDFDVDFKDTIKVIFNETEGSDWYGEFKEKYKKFKEAVNEVENKKKSAQEEAIKLMLFIREKMKKEGLAPTEEFNEELTEDYKKWYDYIIRTNESLIYKDKFKNAVECEEEKKKYDNGKKILRYDYDDWNYSEIAKNEKDKKNCWIKDNTHYYYNELDHYLTHYVENIMQDKNIRFTSKKGKNINTDWGLLSVQTDIDGMKIILNKTK